jgi:hypothetical protein
MNPKPCPNGSINPRSSPKRFAKSRTSFVNPRSLKHFVKSRTRLINPK